MKLGIIYFSDTGNTERMAECIAEGVGRVEEVEVKACSIDAIDVEWMKESNCILFGTPTYYANMAGQMKQFLDTKAGELGLAGKLGGAFATANFVQGGGDLAIQTILTQVMVYGMLVFSGGGAYDMPVIHLGPVALGNDLEAYENTFKVYGERMAGKAKELFS